MPDDASPDGSNRTDAQNAADDEGGGAAQSQPWVIGKGRMMARAEKARERIQARREAKAAEREAAKSGS